MVVFFLLCIITEKPWYCGHLGQSVITRSWDEKSASKTMNINDPRRSKRRPLENAEDFFFLMFTETWAACRCCQESVQAALIVNARLKAARRVLSNVEKNRRARRNKRPAIRRPRSLLAPLPFDFIFPVNLQTGWASRVDPFYIYTEQLNSFEKRPLANDLWRRPEGLFYQRRKKKVVPSPSVPVPVVHLHLDAPAGQTKQFHLRASCFTACEGALK